MPRLSLFHVAAAAAVLAGAATAALALVAVAQLLADRRASRSDRRVLGEIRSSFGSINDDLAELRKRSASFSDELALLNTRSAAINDGLAENADRARRQADSAERRLLASVDAARLEAAGNRAEPNRTN